MHPQPHGPLTLERGSAATTRLAVPAREARIRRAAMGSTAQNPDTGMSATPIKPNASRPTPRNLGTVPVRS